MKIIHILFIIILLIPSQLYGKTRKVTVGTFNAPPLVFYKNTEYQGFYIDLIRTIAEKENWTLHFEHMSWSEGLQRNQ